MIICGPGMLTNPQFSVAPSGTGSKIVITFLASAEPDAAQQRDVVGVVGVLQGSRSANCSNRELTDSYPVYLQASEI